MGIVNSYKQHVSILHHHLRIVGANVLSNTSIGSSSVFDKCWDTLKSGLTVNGEYRRCNGTNILMISSHDGSNGLKLGGTLLSDAAEQSIWI